MIAVTGHSRDLGRAIHERYNAQGFSRSNGYDIAHPWKIYKELNQDIKVFINNARTDDFAQVDLFKYFFDKWKDTDNLIINIGSLAPDWANSRGFVRMYDVHKTALDTASKMGYYSNHNVFVSNIRPSYMNTPWIVDRGVDPKRMLELDEVVDAIDFVIEGWKKGIRVGTLEVERDDRLS